MKNIFRLTGAQHQQLRSHLHSGDGLEAAALGLCGLGTSLNRQVLILHKIFLIPHERCKRTIDSVSWDGRIARPLLEEAMEKNLTIVKFHSHPSGYEQFSELDDIADAAFVESAYGWVENRGSHSSIVMLPNGQMFGRWYSKDIIAYPFERISIVDHHLKFFDNKDSTKQFSEQHLRNIQAFGMGTTRLLSSLRIGVVGCSGTGSPLIEALTRLGVGELVLVDPDKVEHKNLNRIINTTIEDAEQSRLKTQILKEAIAKMGFDTKVFTFATNIYDDMQALKALSTCDMLFGCVDSIDGRHLLNRLAAFYALPYFDLGVKLIADGKGSIEDISTAVHYLLPGQSLVQRKVYTLGQLAAADLKRSSPEMYQEQLEVNYVENADVQEPAVISVNMRAASDAVNELLDKLHHLRTYEESVENAIVKSSILNTLSYGESSHEVDDNLESLIGKGDIEPFLDRIIFSSPKKMEV